MTAIELWWPVKASVSSTRVLPDGDEVFTTLAQELSAHAEWRRWRVDTSQPTCCTPPRPGTLAGPI
ncbi:hypothetical protein [Streptomyces sp. NPDC056105]|uniref:hypothetical protein n=1 Tax=Streptomyces sp. NPDC056105 TaxID=3345714 RepID=UPI0035D5F8BB